MPMPRARVRNPHGVRLLTVLISACALLLPSPALGQQEVRGSVVDAESRTPVEGAMVVLLEGDNMRARVLTAADGSFRLAVPRAGRYALRVDRIGYTSTHTTAFDVAPGATVERAIETSVQPVVLAGLDVKGARRCEVRPAEGLATARVWEEARKALAAATWTAERALYRFTWIRFVRNVDPRGRRILSEERTYQRSFTPRPFVSLDADVLARDGYLHTTGDDRFYYAPDATVLLSDAFLDTHCFALQLGQGDTEGLIGLRFEPIRGRRLPEVEGVLWVEETGGRLRSVEYRYVNLGQEMGVGEAGGEIRFRELPNRTWIVQEWHIRMPRLAEERNERGQPMRYQLLGYRDEGGVVNQVATASGAIVDDDTGLGSIRGMVADSLGRPAAALRVWVQGTEFATVSEPDGSFAFTGIGPGTWSVGTSHPGLEAVGHSGTFQDVVVARGLIQNVRLELPSAGWVIRERCRATPPAIDEAILTGRVLDEDGAPVPGAAVRVLWNDYSLPAAGTPTTNPRDPVWIRRDEDGIGLDADEGGVFTVCHVPSRHTVRASASIGERVSEFAEVWVPGGAEMVSLEIRLPPQLPSAVLQPTVSPSPESDPESSWLAATGFNLRPESALLHLTRREISTLNVDSLVQILRQVPRIEVRLLATGQTEFRLHSSHQWATTPPPRAESCELDFYLNGSLVQQRMGDIWEMSIHRMLYPRDLTGIEVYDASNAPVGSPEACGAVLLWIDRMRHSRDPDFAGSLRGRVIRPSDNAPVAGVMVTLEPGNLQRRTDDQGRFDYGRLPPARYRVMANVPEWGTWSTEVLLRATSTADVLLQVGSPPCSSHSEALTLGV